MKIGEIIAAGFIGIIIIVVVIYGLYALMNNKLPGTQTTAATTTANPAFINRYNITISEYKFTPSFLNLSAGQNVQLKITNNGLINHNFFISGLNVGTTILPPNGIAFINITAIPKGTYIADSQVDGDSALGLKMNISVK